MEVRAGCAPEKRDVAGRAMRLPLEEPALGKAVNEAVAHRAKTPARRLFGFRGNASSLNASRCRGAVRLFVAAEFVNACELLLLPAADNFCCLLLSCLCCCLPAAAAAAARSC